MMTGRTLVESTNMIGSRLHMGGGGGDGDGSSSSLGDWGTLERGARRHVSWGRIGKQVVVGVGVGGVAVRPAEKSWRGGGPDVVPRQVPPCLRHVTSGQIAGVFLWRRRY